MTRHRVNRQERKNDDNVDDEDDEDGIDGDDKDGYCTDEGYDGVAGGVGDNSGDYMKTMQTTFVLMSITRTILIRSHHRPAICYGGDSDEDKDNENGKTKLTDDSNHYRATKPNYETQSLYFNSPFFLPGQNYLPGWPPGGWEN